MHQAILEAGGDGQCRYSEKQRPAQSGMNRPVRQRSRSNAGARLPSSRPGCAAAAPRRAEAEVVPMEVMEEIRSLRKIVEQHLAGFAWGEVARSEPVKTDILRQMLMPDSRRSSRATCCPICRRK
jgi:flagellar biosynthesis protein FlhF